METDHTVIWGTFGENTSSSEFEEYRAGTIQVCKDIQESLISVRRPEDIDIERLGFLRIEIDAALTLLFGEIREESPSCAKSETGAENELIPF